ncbi:MAG: 1,4-dihydroxy-6-naphthoate synthase [Thermodesulfovibrionales bacterium]|nr:1,4-dihydroxy-6-naphthoate synthase [Thermodesulfovibrionales bacterium]
MRTLSLGYSPCPNDTFIFYALVRGKIDTENMGFKEALLDVETLNQMALRSELDITKISYHAFGHLREDYCLLRSGSAIGRGCGPLVVAKEDYTLKDLRGKRIAIPGRLTTANLLLQLFSSIFNLQPSNPPLPPFTPLESPAICGGDDIGKISIPYRKDGALTPPFLTGFTKGGRGGIIEMPFNKIMDAVVKGDVDAGLIIHEGRFTYPSYGLKKVLDLGEWWENDTGLPVPLGGVLAKRNLGKDLIKRADSVIRKSIEYALKHRDEPKFYIKQHSQELEEEVIEQHITLYVNDYSLDIGEEGLSAVRELLRKAEMKGIIKGSRNSLCVT